MTHDPLEVTVAWVTPAIQDVVTVSVPAGATIAAAIARSGLVATRGLDLSQLTVAVFGKRRSLDALVQPGDRIELLRPLLTDPKAARRHRAAGLLPPQRPRRGTPGGRR
ncbi:MAG: RnfH family protein [Casimicrobiaceae bacterium]